MKGRRDPPFKSSETRFPLSEAIGSVRRCINFVVIYFKTMYNKTIIRFGFCNIRNNQQGLGKYRLRAVSCFSLQSYCTRNLSTQAARWIR